MSPRYAIGRLLEALGMAGVLVGLLLGLSNPAHIRLELVYCGAGLAVFYAGYLLERGTRT